MSYDIYLCHVCLGPIWFPWGDKTHLGTGWDCWKKQQEAEDEVDLAGQLVEFTSSAPRHERKRLVQKAEALYAQWRRDHHDRRLFSFLSTQFAKGKNDVVRRFLACLLHQDEERRRKIVDLIVATPAWHKFVRGGRRKRSERSRKGKRRRGQ